MNYGIFITIFKKSESRLVLQAVLEGGVESLSWVTSPPPTFTCDNHTFMYDEYFQDSPINKISTLNFFQQKLCTAHNNKKLTNAMVLTVFFHRLTAALTTAPASFTVAQRGRRDRLTAAGLLVGLLVELDQRAHLVQAAHPAGLQMLLNAQHHLREGRVAPLAHRLLDQAALLELFLAAKVEHCWRRKIDLAENRRELTVEA